MKRTIIMIALCAVCCCKNENQSRNEPDPQPIQTEFLKGGDISMLTLVEDNGGKYRWDGVETDCVKGLAANGFDIVRLRLYNDPGNAAFTPSNRLPKGYQDEEDILGLAKRAKDAGMQIELTFHYSDFWTNGEMQTKPHSWESLTFDQLKKAVYTYTRDFLKRMAAQGTLPEYVSLGNESQAGMLYPDGSTGNMSNLCALYNSGAKAVREVSPDAKIIIHSDDAGNYDKYDWLHSELAAGKVDYDIIGGSYYPYWTGLYPSAIIDWAKKIYAKFGKDIFIMEIGYAWSKNKHDGWPGQLKHNHPYPDELMTQEGQKAFMDEMFSAIKNNPDAHITGLLYWDPIFIPAGDAGWEKGGANVVSNSTLFDFEGNALPVFESFKKQ